MLLYHGSNVEVSHPKICKRLRNLDFGNGFYLTSSKKQASKWSKSVTRRKRKGEPTLNSYYFDESFLSNLNVLKFNTADENWLEFVVRNRKGLPITTQYDLVIGPVANDSTLDVINDYMAGRFNKKIAVELLMPQNLTDQYTFLTQNALQYLVFKGSEQV
ncbi:hypothetical protein P261_01420 [Lachnospiraceae bacterium TWA4]|nr:hypothetical protein P261_01420 [Lachnospiraceae bacterium TWA4]